GLVGAGLVGRRYVYGAIVFHVDLDAGLLDDAADDLAARSNHVADLIGRNVQGVDARGVLADVGIGRGQRLVHLVEDEEASAARLFESLGHDGDGHVGDLDVHLQAGDAFARTGDLEVHVAIVILGARDIGEDGVLIAFHDQAHGDAADMRG